MPALEATNAALRQPLDAIAGPITGAISGLTNFAPGFCDSLKSQVLGLVNTIEGTIGNLVFASAFLLIFAFVVAVLITAAIAWQLGIALPLVG